MDNFIVLCSILTILSLVIIIVYNYKMRKIEYPGQYTVWYKKTFVWHRITSVTGDATIPGNVRVILCQDGTRFEISQTLYTFKYSPERVNVIKNNMSRESGQRI
jgi:hypothetical protein